ncbi:ATPase [Clostridium fermenticellae]|uniref:ATPase n=1 Tax=Clostridium fermenticellae TaxID=2068654 RepID=A0A386H367_9CLOT|nr:ATPase [Clostridium fermenticellae]AYD40028.1 ATPase [Clostridium fermenticellae]
MDVIKLLEYLHEILETSAKVPMTGKVILDKNETLEIVEKIINYLPDELKKAQWIVEEKERILNESIQEAENLKKENLVFLRKQVENHDITKEATERADKIIESAKKNAKSITLGARDYADEILNELDREVTEKKKQLLLNLKSELQGFLVELDSSIKFKTDVIKQNIKELRDMK